MMSYNAPEDKKFKLSIEAIIVSVACTFLAGFLTGESRGYQQAYVQERAEWNEQFQSLVGEDESKK
jgi:hypothetical protein